jgi:hypothetical protein
MSKKHVSGVCLCGAVKVTGTIEKEMFDVCHCGMCRKWNGGPGMSAPATRDVQFQGQDSIAVYNSSEWAERGFCKKCGTHLFYRLKKEGTYALSLGLLENTDHFPFELQIFIDQKPDNYSFANETEKLTEAEVFAKHGG